MVNLEGQVTAGQARMLASQPNARTSMASHLAAYAKQSQLACQAKSTTEARRTRRMKSEQFPYEHSGWRCDLGVSVVQDRVKQSQCPEARCRWRRARRAKQSQFVERWMKAKSCQRKELRRGQWTTLRLEQSQSREFQG
jgi:hypothetical protein